MPPNPPSNGSHAQSDMQIPKSEKKILAPPFPNPGDAPVLYADDTCVLLSGKDLTKLIMVINAELKSLSAWFRSNKLTVNTQKTFFMIFHRSRIKYDSKHCIKMDDCSLNKVNSAKYLGVIIDHKLNWIDHIAYIKNKISKGIGIMYRARNFLNKSSLIGLYYSYIYPYFTHCLETWGCASKTQLNPLFLLQKIIIRIMTFSHYLAHTEPIFNVCTYSHSTSYSFTAPVYLCTNIQ